MPAASVAMSSSHARNQEAMWASQFSRTQRSARGARQDARNPRGAGASRRKITYAGMSASSVTTPIPSLPLDERGSAWQQTRHQEKAATMKPTPPEEVQQMTEENPSIAYDPEAIAAQEEYGMAYREGVAASRRNPFAGLAQMNQARAKLADRMKRIERAVKMAKQVRDWIWRIFGRGSPVEVEGAAGWSWLTTGSAASLYQVVKTIIQPDAAIRATLGKSNGMDDGQFLKGFLSFIEPNSLDPKNPMSWFDGAYGFLIILILWQLFIYVNVAFAIIGAIAMVIYGLAELLGPFGSYLASFL